MARQATAACELHHAFAYFSWTGFYKTAQQAPGWLVVGPYQGSLGCLRIRVGRGAGMQRGCSLCSSRSDSRQQVSAAPVRRPAGLSWCQTSMPSQDTSPATASARLQLGPQLSWQALTACTCRTQSEVVVPLLSAQDNLLGVLDVDSQQPAAFTQADVDGLIRICALLAQ